MATRKPLVLVSGVTAELPAADKIDVPLSSLTQSSAATTQTQTWNGTAWVPAPVGDLLVDDPMYWIGL